MEAIAQSNREKYLVDIGDNRAVVVNTLTQKVSPVMSLGAAESLGARRWRQVEQGSNTSQLAVRLARESLKGKLDEEENKTIRLTAEDNDEQP